MEHEFKVGDIVDWNPGCGERYEPGPYVVVELNPIAGNNITSTLNSVFVQHLDGSPLHFTRDDDDTKVPHEWIMCSRIHKEPFMTAVRSRRHGM